MKPRARNVRNRNRTGTRGEARPSLGWSIPADEMRLHEKYAGLAMVGILAAQTKEPDRVWVRRLSFRIGCDMADEAARLRRKQSR